MSRLLNRVEEFREEMIDGYVAAFGRYVRRVPETAGIVAVDAPAAGRVGVIVGGGSGHWPAFFGLVGAGMASGGVIGEIFASPSAEQAYRVARAVDGGAGLLFVVGNYAGDVMNFGQARDRLAAAGTPVEMVIFNDDVLSAPPAEAGQRRGIAGGFFVFKSAGAAAARGDTLAAVTALTAHANARTRTAGVGFAGCTLPGQREPLFTVAPGMMEVGLGIHGERGSGETALMPAAEVARLLVDALVAETPPGAGQRAAVLLNGLGGTAYEELFVLYGTIARLLAAAGIETVMPRIGEYVTALDMAGCSLSLCWVDDDLEPLLAAGADTPAFTQRGPAALNRYAASAPASTGWGATQPVTARAEPFGRTEAAFVPHAGGGKAGVQARAALAEALAAITAAEPELARLDAATGDGDHGAGMVRGFRAAVAATEGSPATTRATFHLAGTAFQDAAGGASGALVGAWLSALGDAQPEDDATVTFATLRAGFGAGLTAVRALGGAAPGDKTLVDTLEPFTAALAGAAASSDVAWAAALAAGEAGLRATTDLPSRRGRAARLGERGRGHQDPGATSMLIILRAFATAFADLA